MVLTRTGIEWRQQQRMGSLAGNRPGEIPLGGSGAAPDLVHLKSTPKALSLLCLLYGMTLNR